MDSTALTQTEVWTHKIEFQIDQNINYETEEQEKKHRISGYQSKCDRISKPTHNPSNKQ